MIRYYPDLIQGSDEWLAARCGLLTASEMKHIITPALKAASNDKERTHLYEMLAQRISGHVEPHYISDDMLHGREEEVEARTLYAQTYAPVQEMGFITNDQWGFTLGFSPDGLVGEDGIIECKCRRQKFQVETLINRTMPPDFMIQVQTGLLVSGRKWADFVSYSGGLPMVTLRVPASAIVQNAILGAASAFHATLAHKMEQYRAATIAASHLIPTERRVEQEMYL